jgi:hypothetical protein
MGGDVFRSSVATRIPILLTIFPKTLVKSASCKSAYFLGNHQKLFTNTIFRTNLLPFSTELSTGFVDIAAPI